jgi:hypothetical protein
MFTHAMSSSSATAANTISSPRRTLPTTCSCTGITFTPIRALFAGACAAVRFATTLIPACACASVTPGASRATVVR